MSKFTITSILFLIILFALLIQYQQDVFPGWVVFIPVVVYVSLLVVGSVIIGMGFYFKSLCRSSPEDKLVALTFDDGPDPNKTPELLDLLDRFDAPAAFFCLGEKVEKHPEIVKSMDDKDHLLGNHSYSHSPWFDLYSSRKMQDEIHRTNKAIENIIGKQPRLFRPPYGVTNPALGKAIERSGMRSVGWSLRSFDTVNKQEKVKKKLVRRTLPGTVVLFHDTSHEVTDILGFYLNWLKTNGYKVVSLEQLFEVTAYEED
jgi:peptidoglycan/xylan/chitin deacetylase (PgdA/CDA1 family)